VDPVLLRELRELYEKQRNIEPVVAMLRGRGYSKGRSSIVIAEVTGWKLTEAATAVHRSAAWSDVRDDHHAFLSDFEDAMEEMSFNEDD